MLVPSRVPVQRILEEVPPVLLLLAGPALVVLADQGDALATETPAVGAKAVHGLVKGVGRLEVALLARVGLPVAAADLVHVAVHADQSAALLLQAVAVARRPVEVPQRHGHDDRLGRLLRLPRGGGGLLRGWPRGLRRALPLPRAGLRGCRGGRTLRTRSAGGLRAADGRRGRRGGGSQRRGRRARGVGEAREVLLDSLVDRGPPLLLLCGFLGRRVRLQPVRGVAMLVGAPVVGHLIPGLHLRALRARVLLVGDSHALSLEAPAIGL
mmetsp:Transcript_104087/g.321064  ORF Transcript_104087/g.321064 Transcript_104087/m.321064 type:complete len:268 (-) Transcript_104087:862-1665(-)